MAPSRSSTPACASTRDASSCSALVDAGLRVDPDGQFGEPFVDAGLLPSTPSTPVRDALVDAGLAVDPCGQLAESLFDVGGQVVGQALFERGRA